MSPQLLALSEGEAPPSSFVATDVGTDVRIRDMIKVLLRLTDVDHCLGREGRICPAESSRP